MHNSSAQNKKFMSVRLQTEGIGQQDVVCVCYRTCIRCSCVVHWKPEVGISGSESCKYQTGQFEHRVLTSPSILGASNQYLLLQHLFHMIFTHHCQGRFLIGCQLTCKMWCEQSVQSLINFKDMLLSCILCITFLICYSLELLAQDSHHILFLTGSNV